MAIQRKIQVLMNDTEHRDLKRGKGSQHMSILFYAHDAHWVSWELYRKELAQVFTLSKAHGCGLYWIWAHTWLCLMWALIPVKLLSLEPGTHLMKA
jgi:hypothetical protein